MDLAALGLRLDSVILQVFSSLQDSMILARSLCVPPSRHLSPLPNPCSPADLASPGAAPPVSFLHPARPQILPGSTGLKKARNPKGRGCENPGSAGGCSVPPRLWGQHCWWPCGTPPQPGTPSCPPCCFPSPGGGVGGGVRFCFLFCCLKKKKNNQHAILNS